MTQPILRPAEFAKRWRGVSATEKAASQSHFIDLSGCWASPRPSGRTPRASHYAFERRVAKAGGVDGIADVWKRDFFYAAWLVGVIRHNSPYRKC